MTQVKAARRQLRTTPTILMLGFLAVLSMGNACDEVTADDINQYTYVDTDGLVTVSDNIKLGTRGPGESCDPMQPLACASGQCITIWLETAGNANDGMASVCSQVPGTACDADLSFPDGYVDARHSFNPMPPEVLLDAVMSSLDVPYNDLCGYGQSCRLDGNEFLCQPWECGSSRECPPGETCSANFCSVSTSCEDWALDNKQEICDHWKDK